MALDVDAVRARFSALCGPTVFFDGPGGTQVPDSVIDAIADYLRESNANLGGPFGNSRRTDALLAQSRLAAASFLRCEPDEAIFGANMTTLNFTLSRTVGRTLRAGDEILVTKLDHGGNVSPWLELAHDFDVKVGFVEIADDTTLDYDDLERQLTDRTRIVAFPLASNAVGTLTDVQRIVELARSVDALVWADAVHYAPHAPIDVAELGVLVWRFAAAQHRPALPASPSTSTRVSQPVAAPTPHPSGHAAARLAHLVLRARGRCWLSIRAGSATGPVLYEATLEAGGVLRYTLAPGRPRLWLRIGAPWNLELSLNGDPATALPRGARQPPRRLQRPPLCLTAPERIEAVASHKARAIALASRAGRGDPNQGGQMRAHAGDRIVVESERAAQPGRTGVIEEILCEDPVRVRVRWDDGHTSVLTPSAGAATITPAKTAAKA